MDGNCLYTGSRPINEILAARPKGTKAIFQIIQSKDEFELGLVVRISRRNKAVDMMTDEVLPHIKAEDLRFLRYIRSGE